MPASLELALERAATEVGDVESNVDIPEAWELAQRALDTSEDSEVLGKAHYLRARCAELEDEAPEIILAHYRAAEDAAADGEHYGLAGCMAGAQVVLLIEAGEHRDAIETFLRELEYWEHLEPGRQPHLPEARKALNKSYSLVARKRFRYSIKESDQLREIRSELEQEKEEPDLAGELVWNDLARYGTGIWIKEVGSGKYKHEEPGRIRAFAECVLRWTSDPWLTAHAHKVLAEWGRNTGAKVDQRVAAWQEAERIYTEKFEGSETLVLELIEEQVKAYVNAGRRSEAVDTFMRGLDYWAEYEPDLPWPYEWQLDEWRCKHSLKRAYRYLTDRKVRSRVAKRA